MHVQHYFALFLLYVVCASVYMIDDCGQLVGVIKNTASLDGFASYTYS